MSSSSGRSATFRSWSWCSSSPGSRARGSWPLSPQADTRPIPTSARVPRMHLNMVLVDGTDHETLKKGPGRDLRTFMPGENRLVYIAGHRTTYLAPFSHIDALRKGDTVTIEVPYARFVYSVTGHRVV